MTPRPPGWKQATRLARLGLGIAATLALGGAALAETPTFDSELHTFTVRPMVEGLSYPWSVAFLPDGGYLITERPGRLRLASPGRLDPVAVSGLPPIAEHGQGGLLDVVLHPEFDRNRWVYLSYAARGPGGLGTEVARGRLEGHALQELTVIFRAQPKSSGGRHFGSRLAFGPDGLLYITLGERGEQDRAQDFTDHAGSIVRLHDDGRVPENNPLRRDPYAAQGARPEIFTYGNRNPQGLAFEPGTGRLWEHEHGPQGGDEVNIVRAGTNYGWPVITYGRNYVIGTRIGEGEAKPGMAQPVLQWTPSIAPSGMAFYDGDRFPRWRGNLFVGALKFQLLVRLTLDGERVVGEERLLERRYGRIRDVRAGPDGYLYFLTDAADGILARLEPR